MSTSLLAHVALLIGASCSRSPSSSLAFVAAPTALDAPRAERRLHTKRISWHRGTKSVLAGDRDAKRPVVRGRWSTKWTRLEVSASIAGRGAAESSSDSSAAPVEIIEGMDNYFQVLAVNTDSIVVMKVFAGFCRACKAFDRKYRTMATEYEAAGANVKFFEMDWMKNRDLCKSLQVKKLPHIELYAGPRGRLESFVCGPSKAKILRDKIDKLLVDLSDPEAGANAALPDMPVTGSQALPASSPSLHGLGEGKSAEAVSGQAKPAVSEHEPPQPEGG